MHSENQSRTQSAKFCNKEVFYQATEKSLFLDSNKKIRLRMACGWKKDVLEYDKATCNRQQKSKNVFLSLLMCEKTVWLQGVPRVSLFVVLNPLLSFCLFLVVFCVCSFQFVFIALTPETLSCGFLLIVCEEKRKRFRTFERAKIEKKKCFNTKELARSSELSSLAGFKHSKNLCCSCTAKNDVCMDVTNSIFERFRGSKPPSLDAAPWFNLTILGISFFLPWLPLFAFHKERSMLRFFGRQGVSLVLRHF